jgi:hypothetical protein
LSRKNRNQHENFYMIIFNIRQIMYSNYWVDHLKILKPLFNIKAFIQNEDYLNSFTVLQVLPVHSKHNFLHTGANFLQLISTDSSVQGTIGTYHFILFSLLNYKEIKWWDSDCLTFGLPSHTVLTKITWPYSHSRSTIKINKILYK